eukprot:399084-Pelagomonas_calceolata.AAC.7
MSLLSRLQAEEAAVEGAPTCLSTARLRIALMIDRRSAAQEQCPLGKPASLPGTVGLRNALMTAGHSAPQE